jgi:antitoxin VapB
MATTIKINKIEDEGILQLATELSTYTGETVEEAIRSSLSERISKVRQTNGKELAKKALIDVARRCSSRPVIDPRSVDDILGYDKNGLP